MGMKDATCARDSSSIEGCTNSIWEDYQSIKYATEGLRHDPANPAGRVEWIRTTKAGLIRKIVLLGSAPAYKGGSRPADCITTIAPAWAIDRCDIQLKSAELGIKLLSKPEVVATLPPGSRERLKTVYKGQAAQFRHRLDVIAASWAGDPSALCGETYASISACKRAVAMDSDALRRQVFPVYRCGKIVPGEFVTAATDAAEEARHANDPPQERMVWRTLGFSFSSAVQLYQERLANEELRLSQAEKNR